MIEDFKQPGTLKEVQSVSTTGTRTMSEESTALYRRLNGLDLPPNERAECVFLSNAGEAMGLPAGNVAGMKETMARHFEDFETQLSQALARNKELAADIKKLRAFIGMPEDIDDPMDTPMDSFTVDEFIKAHQSMDFEGNVITLTEEGKTE